MILCISITVYNEGKYSYYDIRSYNVFLLSSHFPRVSLVPLFFLSLLHLLINSLLFIKLFHFLKFLLSGIFVLYCLLFLLFLFYLFSFYFILFYSISFFPNFFNLLLSCSPLYFCKSLVLFLLFFSSLFNFLFPSLFNILFPSIFNFLFSFVLFLLNYSSAFFLFLSLFCKFSYH